MKTWYQIKAKKNKRAKILIYEQIGEDWFGDGVSAKDFIKELDTLDVDDIDLHINSPGGNVFDGNSIYNALKAHKANINVKIDGIAASIASVIAMAGDTVEMPKNAMLMIHDPAGFVVGTANDMTKMADALDKIKGGLVSAYLTRADLKEEKISDMMTDETWITAQEALGFGFADKITESVKIEASFQAMANFKNVPKCLTASSNRQTKTENIKKKEESPMEITLELITSKHPEIVTAILKTVTLDHVRAEHPDIVVALSHDGAKKENERIQAVKDQLIPGHEKLIEALMFDGKTTGEQAAVKVLQAEKDIRAKTIAGHQADSPDALKQSQTDDLDTTVDDSKLPIEDRCEATWEKDAKVRHEFMDDYGVFLASEKAIDSGSAKILGKK